MNHVKSYYNPKIEKYIIIIEKAREKLPKKFKFYSNTEFQGIENIYAGGEHECSDDQVFVTEKESCAICDVMNNVNKLIKILKKVMNETPKS